MIGENAVKSEILKLQRLLKEKNIDVYLVPTSDFHQSEYISAYFKEREYLTGFTGSAGTLVVTPKGAFLWTDGRYFIQAEQELAGSEIHLWKSGEEGVPTVNGFLEDLLQPGQIMAFDGRMVSAAQGLEWAKKLENRKVKIQWNENLLDTIWEERPDLPECSAFLLKECYSGKSRAEKLQNVRQIMEQTQASGHLLTALDDIAWLLNLRGDDIAYTPVALAYLYLSMCDACLYISPKALNETDQERLIADGILLKPYDKIYEDLPKITENQEVLLDTSCVNYSLYRRVSGTVVQGENPEKLQKAVKNPIEIKNLIDCHTKDGVALTQFMLWLKKNVRKGVITELGAEEYLEQCRKKQSLYLEPSFRTISAYQEHGAMMHYAATEQSNATLAPKGMLLVDSGGQYLEGTTDVTRTFILGPVSAQAKLHYTTVVRSMLNLASARFLYGCSGGNLDILAREPLWQLGLDYKCGTGHGVGYLLNVHEGPNAFRWKMPHGIDSTAVLEEGMVTTDEPGVYLEGEYGIRIENELLCLKGEKNEYGQFMEFEPLTMVPIDLDGIDTQYMTEVEICSLNQYHKMVFERLAPYFDGEELETLRYYTRPLEKKM